MEYLVKQTYRGMDNEPGGYGYVGKEGMTRDPKKALKFTREQAIGVCESTTPRSAYSPYYIANVKDETSKEESHG